MSLRRLTAKDAAALRALWLEGLSERSDAFLLTPDELSAIPDDRFAAGIDSGVMFGWWTDEALKGYAIARRGGPKRLRHTADIGPVYVTASEQRKGIGRALMQAVMTHLKDEGLLQAELTVDARNSRAIGLYTSLGFVPFGHRPRSVLMEDRPRDDLLMICALDGSRFDTAISLPQ